MSPRKGQKGRKEEKRVVDLSILIESVEDLASQVIKLELPEHGMEEVEILIRIRAGNVIRLFCLTLMKAFPKLLPERSRNFIGWQDMLEIVTAEYDKKVAILEPSQRKIPIGFKLSFDALSEKVAWYQGLLRKIELKYEQEIVEE